MREKSWPRVETHNFSDALWRGCYFDRGRDHCCARAWCRGWKEKSQHEEVEWTKESFESSNVRVTANVRQQTWRSRLIKMCEAVSDGQGSSLCAANMYADGQKVRNLELRHIGARHGTDIVLILDSCMLLLLANLSICREVCTGFKTKGYCRSCSN